MQGNLRLLLWAASVGAATLHAGAPALDAPALAVADKAVNSPALTAATTIPRRPVPGSVPEGFEALFEEQETLVDIYFGNRFLATTPARFTPDEITLLHPPAVVEKIPDLLDPASVIEQLSATQASNQELRCYYRGQENCGRLDADVAGVIFNPDSFRVDLFINPELLAVSNSNGNKYLPPSSAGFSLLQNFNYAFSGIDSDINANSNLYSLTSIAYRQNSLKMVSNYTDGEFFNIQTLAYQRDWDARRLQLGYFLTESQGLRFSREYEIAGARFGTALDMREDLRQSSGNEIQVFLQSRGEVAIFKDGRLISSRIYDAGNQLLDTSDLPGGAYNVEIRISDSGGDRVETQFYVKNNRLPPQDMPLYFLEAGEITIPRPSSTLPNGTSHYLMRAGINKRISGSNALVGGISSTVDDNMVELGWFGMGELYELSLNTAYASGNRFGFNGDFRLNFYRSWLVGNYRQIWGDSDVEENVADLLGYVKRQATFSLNIPVEESRFQFSARYIDGPAQESVDSYTVGWDMPVLRNRNSNLRLNLQYTHDSGQDFFFATLRWRLGRDNWTFNLDPQYVYQASNPGTESYLRGTANANWDSRERWESTLRTNVNASKDQYGHSLGADMQWAGELGRMRLGAEHVTAQADSVTVVNGNIASSFTAAAGGFAMGGEHQNQSAVMIDVGGSAVGLSFDVLVNGGRRGVVRAGKSALITLRPFQSYTVRLRPRGNSFVYFEDKEYSVTLYPGNVVKLDWEVDQVDIIFGRIVGQDGKAVANALLHGVAGLATTDESGTFQAELVQGKRTIEAQTRNATCHIKIPAYQPVNGVASVGVLRCNEEQAL
jgi:hypothetical protein